MSAEAESPPSAFETAIVTNLRPNDVVLFRCEMHLNAAQRDGVVAMLNEVFPEHESVILDGGSDIAVLRPVPGFFRRLFGKST